MTTSPTETERVLGHHLLMFGTADLRGIMADYTEDSVLIMPDQTCRGLAEIRAVFEGMLSMVTPEFMAGFKLVKQEAAGDVAYVNWSVDGFFALGTDTLVIKDSKIAVQTFASHPAG